MHTGMLWFDNSQIPLCEKIKKAMAYYLGKYGRNPDLALVHPSLLEGGKQTDVDGMPVKPYRPVLPGHIWIGIEDKEA